MLDSGWGMYHVGIILDREEGVSIWRRIGDGQIVEFSSDGWSSGSWGNGIPRLYAGSGIYMKWFIYPGYSSNNKVNNYPDNAKYPFICEY